VRGGEKGLHPKGLHPKGLHPKGLHPKGLHPKGLHPQGTPSLGMESLSIPNLLILHHYDELMKDHFKNFEEIKKVRPDSFDIEAIPRESPFLLFAPHGGGIEPGTTEICWWFYKEAYSLYTFSGKGQNCRQLHITSTRFNESTLLEMLDHHDYAISFHGMTNEISSKVNADIYLGGLNKTLIELTTAELRKNGYKVLSNAELTQSHLSGSEEENVTNSCRSGMGMQVELSEKLRQTFFQGVLGSKAGRRFTTGELDRFCEAIMVAIQDFEKSM
jgi:phage replication-related protein YjqB (UPF0714/DUF867 family)